MTYLRIVGDQSRRPLYTAGWLVASTEVTFGNKILQHWLCLTSFSSTGVLLFLRTDVAFTFLVGILDSDWWTVRRFWASHWWRALLLLLMVEGSSHRSRD